jgi:hypothetical protein
VNTAQKNAAAALKTTLAVRFAPVAIKELKMLTFSTYLEFTEKHKFVDREAEWKALRAKYGKDNVYGVNGMWTPTSTTTKSKVHANEKYWDKFMTAKQNNHDPERAAGKNS